MIIIIINNVNLVDKYNVHLEQHELPQRIVPLHEEQAGRRRPAQVLVPVVRVAGDGAPHAAYITTFYYIYQIIPLLWRYKIEKMISRQNLNTFLHTERSLWNGEFHGKKNLWPFLNFTLP